MSFWNTNRIKLACVEQSVVEPYREDRVLHSAYELGVGSEAFVSSHVGQITTQLPEGAKVVIPPGQFGLLVTRETVYVPPNAIAFISMRAGIKFQGLVNVSGFHVDPGYRGRLKFAVYNAGSRDIVLDQDQRVFMIWFADLDDAVPDPYSAPRADGSAGAQGNAITSVDVSRMLGEVASPAELKKQLDALKEDLERKFQITDHARQGNRNFIIGLCVALAVFLFTSYVKPNLDRALLPAPSPTGTEVKPAAAPTSTPVR